ncbi:MAG: retropepsin-like domain-containing protein [Prevotellaceae bacterium]|jgi:hypothetical protein|nr:retropepsin-like domain-containing protein [Prevotellaceae bacterium]
MKEFFKFFIFLILLCLAHFDGIAQKITFELNKFILLDVKINNNYKAKFIFDSGSPMLVINSEFASKNSLEPKEVGKFTAVGIGENNSSETDFVVKNILVCANSLCANVRAFMIVNLNKFIMRNKADGIIGNYLFKNKIFHIDFDNQCFEVIDGKNINYNDYTPLTIYKERENFVIPIKIKIKEKYIEGNMYFDTGNAGRTGVYTKNAEESGLTDLEPVLEYESFNAGLAGGKSSSNYLYADEITIANYSLDSFLIRCSKDKAGALHSINLPKHLPSSIGLLGLDFIKKFNWIIDIKNSKCYIKPSNNFNIKDKNSSYNLVFKYDDQNHCTVSRIIKIAGEKYGVSIGDTILHAGKLFGMPVMPVPISDIAFNPDSYIETPLLITVKNKGNAVITIKKVDY